MLIGVLYYKPVRPYFETRSALTDRAAEVQELRRQRAVLRAARSVDQPRGTRPEARRLGFVKPGERLFIVKGIPAWRKRSATCRRPRMTERSSSASSAGAPRAFRRTVVRCPFGRPAVTEQAPYDDDGRPFLTTYYLTCPHVVAGVSRLEAVGGVERWGNEAAADSTLAASVQGATERQREIRRELAGDRVGPDGGRSLELGIGGARTPERLKCLHAHVAFALAQPGVRARRPRPRGLSSRSGPTAAAWTYRVSAAGASVCGRMAATAVEHARQEWKEGHRRLEAEARDSERAEQGCTASSTSCSPSCAAGRRDIHARAARAGVRRLGGLGARRSPRSVRPGLGAAPDRRQRRGVSPLRPRRHGLPAGGERTEAPASKRRVNRGRLIGMVAGAVALFALGAAFGKAIEENDAGDGTVTYDRTVLIRPLPERVTVTVVRMSASPESRYFGHLSPESRGLGPAPKEREGLAAFEYGLSGTMTSS